MNEKETTELMLKTIREQILADGTGKINWDNITKALWNAKLRFSDKEKKS